jgi:hypothetical protein
MRGVRAHEDCGGGTRLVLGCLRREEVSFE